MALAESVVATLRLVAIDEVSGPAYRATRAIQSMGVAADTAGGSFGRFAITAGLLSGGVIGGAIKAATDFQRTIQFVAGNTLEGRKQMDQLTSSVLNMGKVFPEPLNQIAMAFMRAQNAGFHFGAAMSTIVSESLKSAAVSLADAGDVTNALAHALVVFGYGPDYAAQHLTQFNGKVVEFIDYMHAAAGAANLTMEQMAKAMSQANVLAKVAGFPIQDALAGVAALTRTGLGAPQAATQFRGILNALIAPTNTAKTYIDSLSKSMGVLNLQAEDGTQKHMTLSQAFSQTGASALGIQGIMQALNLAVQGHLDVLRHIIPAQRGMVGGAYLSIQGFSSLVEVLDRMRSAHEQMGITQKQWNLYQQSALYQMGLLRNQVQETAIALGNALLPAFTSIMSAIMPFIGALQSAIKAHPQLVSAILGIGLALGGLALASRAATTVFSQLVLGWNVFEKIGAVPFSPLINGFNTLSGSVGRFGDSLRGLGGAAVGGIFTSLESRAKSFHNVLNTSQRGGVAGRAGEALSAAFPRAGRVVEAAGTGVWNAAAGEVGKYREGLLGLETSYRNLGLQIIANSDRFGIFSGVVQRVGLGFTNIAALGTGLGLSFDRAGREMSVASGLTERFGIISRTAAQQVEILGRWLGNTALFRTFRDGIGVAITSLDGIRRGALSASDAIAKLAEEKVLPSIGGALHSGLEQLGTRANQAHERVSNLGNTVSAFGRKNIGRPVGGALDATVSQAHTEWQLLTTEVAGYRDAVASAFLAAGRSVTGFVSGPLGALRRAVETAVTTTFFNEEGFSRLSVAWTHITTLAESYGNSVSAAFGSMRNKITEFGVLASGVFDRIQSKIVGLASGPIALFNRALYNQEGLNRLTTAWDVIGAHTNQYVTSATSRLNSLWDGVSSRAVRYGTVAAGVIGRTSAAREVSGFAQDLAAVPGDVGAGIIKLRDSLISTESEFGKARLALARFGDAKILSPLGSALDNVRGKFAPIEGAANSARAAMASMAEAGSGLGAAVSAGESEGEKSVGLFMRSLQAQRALLMAPITMIAAPSAIQAGMGHAAQTRQLSQQAEAARKARAEAEKQAREFEEAHGKEREALGKIKPEDRTDDEAARFRVLNRQHGVLQRSVRSTADEHVRLGGEMDDLGRKAPTGVFAAIGSGMESVKNSGSKLGGLFQAILSPVKLLGSAFTSLLGPVMAVFRTLAMFTGIGLILGVIAIAVVAWKKNWGDIQGKVHEAVEFIKAKLNELMNFMTAVFNKVAPVVQPALQGMVSAFSGVVNAIKGIFTPVDTAVRAIGQIPQSLVVLEGANEQTTSKMHSSFLTVANVAQTLGTVINTVVKTITNVFQGLASFISTNTDSFKKAFSSIGDSFREVMTSVGQAVAQISQAFTQLTNAFSGSSSSTDKATNGARQLGEVLGVVLLKAVQALALYISIVAKAISLLATGIADLVAKANQMGVFTSIVRIFNNVVATITTVVDWVTRFGKALGTDLSAHSREFQASFGEMGNSIGRIVSSLEFAFHGLLDVFSTFIGLFTSSSRGSKSAGDSAAGFANILSNVLLAALQGIAGTFDLISRVIAGFIDIFTTYIKVFADNISMIVHLVENLVKVFNDVFSLISDIMHGNFSQFGKDWTTFLNDIKALVLTAFNDIKKIIEDILTGIGQFISDVFGKQVLQAIETVIINLLNKLASLPLPGGITDNFKNWAKQIEQSMQITPKINPPAPVNMNAMSIQGEFSQQVMDQYNTALNSGKRVGAASAAGARSKGGDHKNAGAANAKDYALGFTDQLPASTQAALGQANSVERQLRGQLQNAGKAHMQLYATSLRAGASDVQSSTNVIANTMIGGLSNSAFKAGQQWSNQFVAGVNNGQNRMSDALQAGIKKGLTGINLTEFLAGAGGGQANQTYSQAIGDLRTIGSVTIPTLMKDINALPPSISSQLMPKFQSTLNDYQRIFANNAQSTTRILQQHEQRLAAINQTYDNSLRNAHEANQNALKKLNADYLSQLKTLQNDRSKIDKQLQNPKTTPEQRSDLGKQLDANSKSQEKLSNKFVADYGKENTKAALNMNTAQERASRTRSEQLAHEATIWQTAQNNLQTVTMGSVNTLHQHLMQFIDEYRTASTPDKIWDAIQQATSNKLTATLKSMNLAFYHGTGIQDLMTQAQKLTVEQDNQTLAAARTSMAFGQATGNLQTWNQGITDATNVLSTQLVAGTARAGSAWTTGIESMLRRQNDSYTQTQVRAGLMDAQIGKATDNLTLWQNGLKQADDALHTQLITSLAEGRGANETQLSSLVNIISQEAKLSDATNRLAAMIDLRVGDISSLGSALKNVSDTIEGTVIAGLLEGHNENQKSINQVIQLTNLQTQLATATSLVSAQVSLATGNLSQFNTDLTNVQSTLTNEFIGAFISGKGNLGDFLNTLIATTRVQNDYNALVAGSSIVIGRATGNFDTFNKGLTDASTLLTNEIMARLMSGSTAISAYFNQLVQVTNTQRQVTESTDLFKARLDLATGSLSDFTSSLGGVITETMNTISQKALSGQNYTGDIATVVQLTQAQQQATQIQAGLTAQVDLATGNIKGLSDFVSGQLTTSINQWEAAFMSTGNAQNQYTAGVIQAQKMQADWNNSVSAMNYTLGTTTGNLTLFNDGLNGFFTTALNALQVFAAGISTDPTTNITKLSDAALTAANNLSTMPDIIKGIGDVASSIKTKIETDFYRTGQVNPADLTAYSQANRQQANANLMTGGADEIIARATADPAAAVKAVQEQTDAFKTIVQSDIAQYGLKGAQTQTDLKTYLGLKDELQGLDDATKILNGDFTGLSRGAIAQAQQAWQAFNNGTDAATQVVKTFGQTVPSTAAQQVSKTPIQQANDDIKSFADNLAALGKTLGPTINQLLQQYVGRGFSDAIGRVLMNQGSAIRKDFTDLVLTPMANALGGWAKQLQGILTSSGISFAGANKRAPLPKTTVKPAAFTEPTSIVVSHPRQPATPTTRQRATPPTSPPRTPSARPTTTPVPRVPSTRPVRETTPVIHTPATHQRRTPPPVAPTPATAQVQLLGTNSARTAQSIQDMGTRASSAFRINTRTAPVPTGTRLTTATRPTAVPSRPATTARTQQDTSHLVNLDRGLDTTTSHLKTFSDALTAVATQHRTVSNQSAGAQGTARSQILSLSQTVGSAARNVQGFSGEVNTATARQHAAATSTNTTQAATRSHITLFGGTLDTATSHVKTFSNEMVLASRKPSATGTHTTKKTTAPKVTGTVLSPDTITKLFSETLIPQITATATAFQTGLNPQVTSLVGAITGAAQAIVSAATQLVQAIAQATGGTAPSIPAITQPATGAAIGTVGLPAATLAPPAVTTATGTTTVPATTTATDTTANAQYRADLKSTSDSLKAQSDAIQAQQDQIKYTQDQQGVAADQSDLAAATSFFDPSTAPDLFNQLNQTTTSDTLSTAREGIDIEQKQLETLQSMDNATQAIANNTNSINSTLQQTNNALQSQVASLLQLVHLGRLNLSSSGIGGGGFMNWLDNLGGASMANTGR